MSKIYTEDTDIDQRLIGRRFLWLVPENFSTVISVTRKGFYSADKVSLFESWKQQKEIWNGSKLQLVEWSWWKAELFLKLNDRDGRLNYFWSSILQICKSGFLITVI